MTSTLIRKREEAKKTYRCNDTYSGYFKNITTFKPDEFYSEVRKNAVACFHKHPSNKLLPQIINQVDALANKKPNQDTYLQLSEVLYRCHLALEPAFEPRTKPQKNLDQLTQLAKKLPGHAGAGWKTLGYLLMVFASVAMMTGFLMVFPFSGPLMMTCLAYVGLTSIASVVSSFATAMVASGAAAVGHGVTATTFAGVVGIGGGFVTTTVGSIVSNDSGLAKSVADFRKQLPQRSHVIEQTESDSTLPPFSPSLR